MAQRPIRGKDSDMAKIEEYDVTDVDILCKLGKALSSPIRIEMLHILSRETLNIGEIAKKTGIPASSAAFHLKMLEEAGLVRMEEQPGRLRRQEGETNTPEMADRIQPRDDSNIVNEINHFVYDILARRIIAGLSRRKPQLLSSLTKNT